MVSKVRLAAFMLLICACSQLAYAQQTKKIVRVGFLSSGSREQFSQPYDAFLRSLWDRGYMDGQNVMILPRWSNGNTDQLKILAAELVRIPADVIVSTGGTVTALAAKNATTTIPIVFTAGGNLIQVGLIESLARPGGNLTGLSLLTVEIGAKRLELLKETLPKIRRVAVLGNPRNPAYKTQVAEVNAAAKPLGLQIQIVEAGMPEDFGTAFSAMKKERAGALLVLTDAMFNAQRLRLVELAANNRIPAIYDFKEFAEAGGLMSYGADINDVYRRAAIYVDKIIKGSKPSELPVEQPTEFQFL